jgi:hypothetical protein
MNWYKKAQLFNLGDVENMSSLQEIVDFLSSNNVSYDLIDFPTGKKVIRVKDYIIDDFENPYLEKIDNWFYKIQDYNIDQFYEVKDFNQEFWDGLGNGFTLYHATHKENLQEILKNGILPKNNSRGINNRSTMSAVFTSDNPNDIRSYGDVVLEINMSEMKRDGYMPTVDKESPLSVSEYKNAIANKIGMEDYHDEDSYASEGLYESTVVIFGKIPPKYIKVH